MLTGFSSFAELQSSSDRDVRVCGEPQRFRKRRGTIAGEPRDILHKRLEIATVG